MSRNHVKSDGTHHGNGLYMCIFGCVVVVGLVALGLGRGIYLNGTGNKIDQKNPIDFVNGR